MVVSGCKWTGGPENKVGAAQTLDAAVAQVRTDLEIDEAVLLVAEEALDSRQNAGSGSTREARTSASEHAAAVVARDRTDRELAADRAS